MMLEKLDSIQYDAVTCPDRDILCDSKAGSGKTRVLMNRCLWLLENGAQPEEIMLVTFTNKAANEMMNRIRALSPVGDKILCGTFHFIAMKYIREFADKLGFDRNFTILSPDDAVKRMKGAVKTYSLLHPAKEIEDDELFKAKKLTNLYSASRNLDFEFEDYLTEKLEYSPYTYSQAEDAKAIIELFSRLKKADNIMDFDDLLENFRKLLSMPDVNEAILKNFKYIMVDEYQDINKVQNVIIFYLRGMDRNLFVVGDPYQCIYGFRGSKVEYIQDFPDNYAASVFKVENNYRSSQPILDAASEITSGKASMYSMITGGERPILKLCYSNFEQADIIGRYVKNLIDNGKDPEQIAILTRSTIDIMLVEQALNKLGIPYVMRAGFSYFERVHIKDILMMLMTIVNPKNKDALRRVLSLFDGFGAKTIETCVSHVESKGSNIFGLYDDILDGTLKVSKKAKLGAENIKKAYFGISSTLKIEAQITLFCNNFYYAYLSSHFPEDSTERSSDIGNLMALAEKYTDAQLFINESIVDSSVNNKENGDKKSKKIVISTIHRAKGLEWDHCIIVNMNNRFAKPSYDEKTDDGFDVPEDVRLMYVAITRAKKTLLITANKTDYQGRIKTRVNLAYLLPKLNSCRLK